MLTLCHLQSWVEGDENISAGRQRMFCEGWEVSGRTTMLEFCTVQGHMHGRDVDVIMEPPLSQVLLSADIGGECACYKHVTMGTLYPKVLRLFTAAVHRPPHIKSPTSQYADEAQV